MKNPDLRRLKIATNLIKISLELLPYPKCENQYQCKSCDPTCKAANAINSALYWVEDVARRLDELEKEHHHEGEGEDHGKRD